MKENKRDKTHEDQIERWAKYVKENPDWKMKIKAFLDSQILVARRAYDTLSKTPEGKKKIKELKKII
jgi:hypothetical protein